MIDIAFDVGGTFVDVVVRRDSDRRWASKKVLIGESSERAALEAVQSALALIDGQPDEVGFVAHGTTLATNIVIEEKGARVALVTSRGFRDVLEIGRQDRPSIYDSRSNRPAPLVPRSRRFEIAERIGPDGGVIEALGLGSVEGVVGHLIEDPVDVVAVCLLHSWKNPTHERLVGERIKQALPEVMVMLSSNIAPQYREYERTSTAVVSAYVLPALSSYLRALETSLVDRGIRVPLWIMQSNGGLATVDEILQRPASAQFSGPAAGVLGALAVAKRAGHSNIVALDVGGTSTDVTLVLDGQPGVQRERLVRGQPVLDSSIAVHSVGAGGGSIAWIDPGGLLKVGPHSASARPGPACYGRGGTEATVTDAHLLLGYLSEERPLAANLRLSAALAEAAVSRLAQRLHLSLEEAATGIVEVATVNVVRALRKATVEAGHDPRDFTLVAYGGGGPLYACLLLGELSLARALVPVAAGVLSASGLLAAGPRLDLIQTYVVQMGDGSYTGVRSLLRQLEVNARERMREQGFGDDATRIQWNLDLRYVGQSHELIVQLVDAGDLTIEPLSTALDEFHAAHERAFGVAAPTEPVECVAVRVVATVHRPIVALEAREPVESKQATRALRTPSGWVDATVLERDSLAAGQVLKGPALVDSDDTTVAVLPGYLVRVLEDGMLELTGEPMDQHESARSG